MLLNPRVEAAVLETARGGILREGLGFDRCDVAVVTNIGEGDHLGLAGIETPEELAWVKQHDRRRRAPQWRRRPQRRRPAGGRDGRDTARAGDLLRPRRRAPVVTCSTEPAAGRAVFVRDGLIVLAEGDRETAVRCLGRRRR